MASPATGGELMIKVLFFAQLGELAGRDSMELDSSQSLKLSELIKVLEKSLPVELIESVSDEATMVSVNQAISNRVVLVNDGDEVAFLPPFSGG